MFRRLIGNTLISAVAFLATAGIPFILVPLLVSHYGISEYGLLVLVRILIPTGVLAVFDFGNSEIATHTIVRARESGDWRCAGQRLLALCTITFIAGLIVSFVLGLSADYLESVFKVSEKSHESFGTIILMTSISFVFLLLGLILEGVLKGFEVFKLLRIVEVSSASAYGIAAIFCIFSGLEYQWIAYAYLISLLIRAVVNFFITLVLLRNKGIHFNRPKGEIWRDVARRCRLMGGNRVLGAVQSQGAPLTIGVFLGSGAVGVYDLIIRFPRFLKVIIGLMNTAVLPVAVSLDAQKDTQGMRKLGNLGLLGIIAIAAPICSWGMVFSEPILRLWIDEKYSAFSGWQAMMFIVPLVNAMTSFSCGALLGRPNFIAKLNMIVFFQIFIQFALGIAFMDYLEERSFVLGQIIAVSISFPFQMWLATVEQRLSWSIFRRHFCIIFVFAILVWLFYAVDLDALIDSVFDLLLALIIWQVFSYLAMWFLILKPDEREALFFLGRLRVRKKTIVLQG